MRVFCYFVLLAAPYLFCLATFISFTWLANREAVGRAPPAVRIVPMHMEGHRERGHLQNHLLQMQISLSDYQRPSQNRILDPIGGGMPSPF